MIKIWLILIAALATVACDDNVPRASTVADADGKAFAPPRPDRAALYVVSPERTGDLLDMTLNQRQLGSLGRSTYLRVDVPSGAYLLRCRFAGDAGRQIALSLAPGSTTYVYARSSSVNAPPYCQMHQMDAGAGRSTVLTTTRIQEIGGASD